MGGKAKYRGDLPWKTSGALLCSSGVVFSMQIVAVVIVVLISIIVEVVGSGSVAGGELGGELGGKWVVVKYM